MAKTLFVGLLLAVGTFMITASVLRGRHHGWTRTARSWIRLTVVVALWATATIAAVVFGNDQRQGALTLLCIAGFSAALARGNADLQLSRRDRTAGTRLPTPLRVENGRWDGQPHRMAEVTVFRPGDHAGTLRRLKVYVDGEEAAALRPNERAILTVPAGHHVVHGAMDWTRSRKLELGLHAGDTAAVEVSLPFSSAWGSFFTPQTAIKIKQTG